jgi:hypothetical protein
MTLPCEGEMELAALRLALARAEARAMQLEQALLETVHAHDRLAKEFHHRIKNSLQVIQSYLALSRRQRGPERNAHLVEAEAKILVISGACRMALGDGQEHLLSVKTFTGETIRSALMLLPNADQRVSVWAPVAAFLPFDKAIPLGLAIIEAAIVGLSVTPAGEISLRVEPDQPDQVHATLSLPAHAEAIPAPSRVMQGLCAQLGAEQRPASPGIVLDWVIPVLPAISPP